MKTIQCASAVTAAFLSLALTSAEAATVAITAGSGTNFLTTVDGSGNNVSESALCGGASATLPTSCAYQAQVNSSGQLSVTGPVTQSGTWSITNVSGTVSLPTGAATSANQPTNAAAGSASSGETGTVGFGFTTTASPAYTTGQSNALSLDTSGGLRVDCITGCSAGSNLSVGSIGSNAPSSATLAGVNGNGNLAPLIQASASAKIDISTATTTQLVALNAGKAIYVTAFNAISNGTGNIALEYGTGTNCGTGTTVLTGAYPMVANLGISHGSGLGPVLVVPAGNALCALTSAAVQMSGSVAYAQF